MAERHPPGEGLQEYRYRLLRYVANPISGEFYSIAVVLYDTSGRVIGARFTPDFRRMRCNPAVRIDELSLLRDEFEERLLLGENFSGYFEDLIRNASNSIEATDLISTHCADARQEIERLVQQALATPPALEDGRDESERRLGGRRGMRLRMTEAFARRGLFRNGHGMQRDVSVEYDRSGLQFVFDFEYRRPSSEQRFVQALALRSAEAEAARLCFVLQGRRQLHPGESGLTVVTDDSLGNDVRDLLARHGVGAVNLSAIDGYAESVRIELGF